MFQFCQIQNNRKLFTDRRTDKQKDRQTNQIIEAPPWSLIRIWNVCCYSHYYTFPYIYKFGQIKVFQKMSTDRQTGRGTDRQTNLLMEAPSRSLKTPLTLRYQNIVQDILEVKEKLSRYQWLGCLDIKDEVSELKKEVFGYIDSYSDWRWCELDLIDDRM